ncbi:MAG: hypothetical protein WCH01_15095, partial [Methylococcaceae bacterium]
MKGWLSNASLRSWSDASWEHLWRWLPLFFLTQGTRYVDLDGPLLLTKDRQPGLHYEGSQIFPPDGALW